MRAAVLNEVGGIPSPGEFDEPEDGEDGVVVEVSVAGLNPVDLATASGVMGDLPTPSVAGRVVAAARSAEYLEHAVELGADATVSLDADRDAIAAALAAEAGDGYDVILDPLWGDPASVALKSIATRGRMIQIGNSAGTEAAFTAHDMRSKGASILGHINFLVPTEAKADAFQRMCRHAAAGELQVEVEEIPLERIAEAWERQAKGPHRKLVIRP